MDRWHDIIRDWLLTWVDERTKYPVAREPYVAEWDYWEKNARGVRELVKARLDGGFHFPKGGLGYFDVVIPDAATADPHAINARAHNEGAAAHGAVLFKLNKYAPDKHPGATLVPFAVEALGRPSEPVLQLFRDLAPKEPSERAAVLKDAHYRLSTLVAMRQAELQMAAEGAAVYGGTPRKPVLPSQNDRRPRLGPTDLATLTAPDATGERGTQLGHSPPGWAEPAP